MIRVLFVCMGNICRSPIAQAVLERRLREEGLDGQVEVDSAATHPHHVGDPPDPRACEAAARRGLEIGGQRARQVCAEDFERFDFILAMDEDNLHMLRRRCPPQAPARLERLLALCLEAPFGGNVPDPYYGGPSGFDTVIDLVEQGVDALLGELRARLGAQGAGGR